MHLWYTYDLSRSANQLCTDLRGSVMNLLYKCLQGVALSYFAVDLCRTADLEARHRVRQLYKNISMLFLFPVKDGKLSTGVNATFNASCYG